MFNLWSSRAKKHGKFTMSFLNLLALLTIFYSPFLPIISVVQAKSVQSNQTAPAVQTQEDKNASDQGKLTPQPTPQQPQGKVENKNKTPQSNKATTTDGSQAKGVRPTQTPVEDIKKEDVAITPIANTQSNWTDNNGTFTTTNPVQVGIDYVVSQLGGLKIVFTRLPVTPGKITVKEVTVPSQIDGDTTISKGYEVTSDMTNGEFTYNLYLPKPATDQTISVKYSEDGVNFSDVSNDVSLLTQYVVITNLDHFTVFLISADTNGTNGTGSYTTINNGFPRVRENSTAQIGLGTIILNAPSGFEFDPTSSPKVRVNCVGTCAGNVAANNINGIADNTLTAVTSVTTTQITFTVTSQSNTGFRNRLDFHQIRLRPIAGNPLSTSSAFTLGSGSASLTGTTFLTNSDTIDEVAGAVSTSSSTVDASPAAVPADGTTSLVTVTLKDAFNNPVSGKTVTLAQTSGAGTPTIGAASGASDAAGVVTFTVSSTNNYVGTFTATDTTDAVIVADTAQVTFGDVVAPTLTQITPVPTPTNNTTPSYTFNSTEAGTINYSGDCSSATTVAVAGSNVVTFNTLTEATHSNCTITVTDAAANTSVALNVSAFTIDTTAPTVAEVTPVTTPTNNTTPNYTFSSTETGTINYAGDCSSATTAAVVGNNTVAFNTLAEGLHNNCTVTVTDAAGNTSTVLNVTAFTIDTTAPTLAEVTPVTSPTNDTTPDYTFSTDEAGTINYGGDCSSAITVAAVGNNLVTFNALLDGAHTNCTITVTDAAGNTSAALNVSAFTVDTAAPTVTEVTPVATYTNDTTPDYTFNTTEAGTINYAGDCSSATTAAVVGNNTVTFNALPEALHNNCTITVTDAANNTSTVLNITAFTVDTTAPATDPSGFSSNPAISTFSNDNTVDVSWTTQGTDLLSGVDGYSYSFTQNPTDVPDNVKDIEETATTVTSTALTTGTWYFHIRTVDNAGNWTSTAHYGPFFIDTTAPVVGAIVITPAAQNPDPYVRGNGAGFTITANLTENQSGIDGTTCQYTINGITWNSATFTPTPAPGKCSANGLTAADAASLTINVRVTDNAGNVGTGTPVLRTADSAAPALSGFVISPDIAGTFTSATPTLTGTITDSVSPIILCQYRYKLNSAVWASVAWNLGVWTPAGDPRTGTCTANISGLTDGSKYNFQMRGRDTVGHNSPTSAALTITRTVDATAPVLAEVTPVTTPTNDNTPNYTFSSTEAGTITYGGGCASATTAAIAGSNVITLNALADGTYAACTITVTDAATNVSNVLTITSFTIDTVAPTLAEVTPVPALTSDNTPNYTFSSDEAGTINYAGDCSSATTAAIASNNTVTFNTLADGLHNNCTITVTDAAGNTSTVLNVSAFTVDTVAPTVTEVTPVPSVTNDNTPDYTFNTTEAGTINYAGDCSSATTAAVVGNNTVTFNTLADGLHNNCTITVTDAANNTSTVLNITAFTVDTTAPVVAEVTPITTPTNDNTPDYTFSSTEVGTITYGGGCTSATTTAVVGNNTITLSALADGTYAACTITVTDAATNVSNVLTITSFTIDTVAPTLAEVTPVPALTSDNTPNYTFSSDEAGTINYAGDCSSATTAAIASNNTVTFNTLADGLHNNCTITVTDAAGNTSTVLNVSAFTVDTTGPVISNVAVTTDFNPYVDGSGAGFSISADVADASTVTGCEYTLNGTTWNTATYNSGAGTCVALNLTVANNTALTINMRATDILANVGTGSALSRTADSTAPALTITTPVDDAFISGAFTVSGTATDSISGVNQIRVRFRRESDNALVATFFATYDSGTGTWSLNLNPGDVPDGYYLIRVRADDNVNNRRTKTVRRVTLDNVAPVLAEVTPVTTPTNDNTPAYTFSSTEVGTINYGGDCSSATTAAVVGNNTISFNTLADGAHTNCTITVTDASGNTSTILNVTAFTVDTVAPTLAEVTPVPTYTNDTTPDYTFSSDEAGTINYAGDCSSVTTAAGATNNTVTFNTLTEGLHNNCTITVTDAAGNTSTVLNVSAFTVDTTAPVVSFTDDVAVGPVTSDTIIITVTDTNPDAATYEYGFSSDNVCDNTDTYGNAFTSGVGFVINTETNNGNYICARATDLAGNTTYQVSANVLNIDVTAPAIPTLVSPADGVVINAAGLILDWTDSTDTNGPVTYVYQSALTNTVGANNALTAPIYNSGTLGTSQIDASGSADNTYYWQVRACDALGNCSDWSGPWQLTVDSTNPVITFTDDVAAGPVTSDTIIITVTDVNPDTTTYAYGFSADNICDATDTYSTAFTSGSSFVINTEANNGMWICAKAVDLAGNTTYQVSANPLNIDVTPPAIPALVSPADGAYVNSTSLILDWTDTTDTNGPVTYVYQSSLSNAVGANNALTSPIYTSGTLPTSQIDASGSADNVYYWQVRACDALGNCSDWSGPWTLTVDSTPPTVAFTDDVAAGPVQSDDVIITATDVNPDTTTYAYAFSSDNICDATDAYSNAFTSNATITFNTEANNGMWICARATDLAGNTTYQVSANPLNIDITPPVITIDSLYTNDNTPTLTGTIDDPTATIQLILNGNTYYPVNNGDGTWTLADNIISPALVDGTYDVGVSATDTAGNVGNDTTTNELTVDTVDPTASITAPAANAYVHGTITISGTASDETHLSSVLLGIDIFVQGWCTNNVEGLTPVPNPTSAPAYPTPLPNGATYSCSFDTTTLADGTYTIYLAAFDAAGNSVIVTEDVTVDNTAPAVSFTDDVDAGPTTSDDIAITVTDTNPDTTTYAYAFSSDNICDATDTYSNAFTSGTPFTINTETNNGMWICASATDLAGNTTYQVSANPLNIDITPPVLAEVTPVPTNTNDTTPDYTFSSTEAGTIIYSGDCSSATTAAVVGNNTVTFNTLVEGLHNNCTITVTDAAGNTSTVLNVTAFTVDTTAPTLAEVTPVATPTNDNTPNYTFSSDEAGTINYAGDCSSATSAAVASNNTVTFNTLIDGSHSNCTITVTDAAGNTSTILNVTAFTVDTVAPIVTVTTLTTTDHTPQLTGTVNDNTASISVTVNGNTYAATNNGDGTWTLANDIISPALVNGVYNVSASATDTAGNIGTDSTTNELTIADAAPAVVLFGNSPATNSGGKIHVVAGTSFTVTANLSVFGNPNYNYSFGGICSGNSTNVSSTTVISNTLNLAAGTYSCFVTVQDSDGDIASASVQIIVTAPSGSVQGLSTSDLGTTTDTQTPVSFPTEPGAVLGENTCTAASQVSGDVFIDANGNKQMDNGETGVGSISLTINLVTNGSEQFVKSVRTNSSGHWNTDLCPGQYNVKLNKDGLPNNTQVTNDTVSATVTEGANLANVSFALAQIAQAGFNFMWCILGIVALLILAGLAALVARRRENT